MENQNQITHLNLQFNKGLTNAEVEQRKEQGFINTEKVKITKSNFAIFKDNVLTLFNLFNLLIGIALAIVGAYTNMLYLVIILINILIGIVQEVRGRNLVNKLSLINAQQICVIRESANCEIPISEIVIDDIIVLKSGNQIPVDAIIVEGEIEVNESLLTGESDTIIKSSGSQLLSGSFVTSGKCHARVQCVGVDNFISKLAMGAKKHKAIKSELISSMRKVTKLTSFFILPIGILLFVEAFFIRSEILSDSVVGSAAALLGMLPKGLVLLISIALAAGVINLSQKKVLVQQPHAIETLAHVDLLCLDKTGTITEGNMKVSNFYIENIDGMSVSSEKALNLFATGSSDDNATMIAIKDYFTTDDSLEVISRVAFSSDRKWSAVSFNNLGTIVLGAPERLVNKETAIPKKILNIDSEGKRILYAGFCKQKIQDGKLPELKIFAAIEISDCIRKNAAETLAFFKKEGVGVKIISGDNPLTVSEIAKQAGLENYNSYIDMSALQSDEEITAAAQKYCIFGRVTPFQKKQLIIAFKEMGHTVAMVGDGVNDVLALREADCGIALSCGSDASKQVSQLVLTNSDFTSLPDVVLEGRRVVNNITRVAGIFFIKTIYSVILSILFICLNLPFPFMPIQITLIDLAIEAYPSLFMSFERETGRIRDKFLRTALFKALPFAILILINIIALVIINEFTTIPKGELVAMMYLITGFISAAAVFKVCIPFNKLRIFLAATSSVGFFVAVYLFPSLLQLELPSLSNIWIVLINAVVCVPMIFMLVKLVDSTTKSRAIKDK